MKKKTIQFSALAASLFAAAFTYGLSQGWSNEANYCACTETAQADLSLPLSHPVNRCAMAADGTQVSWFSWFSGKSFSGQFHYLDLLELLSRHSDTEQHPNS